MLGFASTINRLYNQCVLPTMSYGIHEIGITNRNFQSIIGMIHKYHRTMARSPVHLTREPTMAFYARMQLEPPWQFPDRQQKCLTESFDRSKDSIVPIAARPSLRMHFRYKSIPGLLLDKPLISELAHHCAYCHQAIPARSIRKHYSEQHQGLLAFEAVHMDSVYGLVNLGSGRGACIFCEQKSNDIRQHQCGVLLQISTLLGQTYNASHFPVMPTMIRPWNPDSEAVDTGGHDPTPPNPGSSVQPEQDLESPVPNTELVASNPAPKPTPLFRCQACHTTFLTEIGLIVHHAKFPQHASDECAEVSGALPPTRPEHRIPRITVKHMLACRPDGPCPVPARMYTCPLCKESVGRKALVSHLRKFHDIHRPDGFSFEPQIDMHPGHLACNHCHASFSMEIALRTHFPRAFCPVLLCTWTSHQHFGKPLDSSCFQETKSMSDARNQTQHRWCPGLSVPENTSSWTPEAAQALIHSPRHDMKSMIPFDPEVKLKWFHDSLTQIAHHPDMPLSNLPQDSVFNFLAYLHELNPLSWAWHSMEPTPADVLPINMPEHLRDQLTDLHSTLHSIEHALAQDWTLWCQSNHYDGRGDARRRSELFRLAGGLQSAHRQ